MSEYLVYIFFILGFILLLKGADLLVHGSCSIAKKFNVPDIIVGLTIVSLGTSAPELFVNVLSSLEGNAGIGIGNIFGSNIANILLILGISAIIFPLPVHRNTVLSEIPFSLTATLLVGFLANAALFFEISLDSLSLITRTLYLDRYDGIILLLFFLLFMAYIIKITNEQADREKMNMILGRTEKKEPDFSFGELPVKKSVIYIILGIFGLFLGGKWVVDGAIHVAKNFGFSDSFIGLTIIAIGTSLPELVTSATAAFKKKADIAVGNVVGSNIFNMLWILGLSAVIKPLPFDLISNFDLMIIIIASALLIFSMVLGKKYVIERWNGIVFIVIYIGYLIFLVLRG
ncbi:calcium/sodium antiporter [Bacteroidota bacterium]